MRKAEFARETRGEEKVLRPWERNTYYADAWFGSIPAVVAASQNNCNLVCVVKTAHRQYPKKFLEEKMKDWPPGSNLVLKSKLHGVNLVAVGYKYSRKKVLCFLYNEGAGTIQPGKPYMAKWKDKFGNTNSKLVPRPDVISRYFSDSNVIDVHNQSRQHDLHLEKNWVTRDGYFRVNTTLFGMCVVDSWKAYKHHTSPRHRHHNIELMDYVSILTKDMLTNQCSRTIHKPPDTFNVREEGDEVGATGVSSGPAVSMLINANNETSVPATERLTQDSSLDATTLAGLTVTNQNQQSKTLPNYMAKPEVNHNLVRTQEWTTESVENLNEDTGEITFKQVKRRKRGVCVYCKLKTSFHCPHCKPPIKSTKFWVCGHDTPKGKLCRLKHDREWLDADLEEN